MDFGIAGKVALVSGGTQGIGFAAAQALLNEGVTVAIFSRSRDNVDQALAKLDAGTSKVSGFTCDLLDETSVEEMLAKVRAELGSIDIFVGSFQALDLNAIKAVVIGNHQIRLHTMVNRRYENLPSIA